MTSEKNVTNILLIGVGGQGIILVSDILSSALMRQGYDVKKSEVHGMAQRGGSVSTHVRFGTKVYSPLIPEDETDFIVAFEEMEALRYQPFLHAGAAVILNRSRINPPAVFLGKATYPNDVAEQIGEITKLLVVDGPKLANTVGNPRVENVIVMGLLSTFLDVEEENWLTALKEGLPPKLYEINEKAFLLGREQRNL